MFSRCFLAVCLCFSVQISFWWWLLGLYLTEFLSFFSGSIMFEIKHFHGGFLSFCDSYRFYESWWLSWHVNGFLRLECCILDMLGFAEEAPQKVSLKGPAKGVHKRQHKASYSLSFIVCWRKTCSQAKQVAAPAFFGEKANEYVHLEQKNSSTTFLDLHSPLSATIFASCLHSVTRTYLGFAEKI